MAKKNFLQLPSWLRSSLFYRGRLKNNYGGDFAKEPMSQCHPYDANLIASEKIDGRHNILLDLDCQHFYLESTTGGHGHLYIKANATMEEYLELLTLLTKLGIIQEGFKNAAEIRKMGTLRLPGLKKGNYEDERWFYDQIMPPTSPDPIFTPEDVEDFISKIKSVEPNKIEADPEDLQIKSDIVDLFGDNFDKKEGEIND